MSSLDYNMFCGHTTQQCTIVVLVHARGMITWHKYSLCSFHSLPVAWIKYIIFIRFHYIHVHMQHYRLTQCSDSDIRVDSLLE